MEGPVHERWVLLRLRLGYDGLWVGYEDSDGQRRSLPTDLGGPSLGLFPAPPFARRGLDMPPALSNPTWWIPGDLGKLLREALPSTPTVRYGPHSNGPIPLPVFVAPPPEAAVLPWEDLALDLILNTALDPGQVQTVRDQVQMVRLARQKWARRSPFRLPIKVLAVGARGNDALSVLRTDYWYQGDPLTQEYGLRLERAFPEQAAAFMRTQAYHVVVTEQEGVQGVLRGIARLALEQRPRLVLVLGAPSAFGLPLFGAPLSGTPDAAQAHALRLLLPAGTSFLWAPFAPPPETAEFARQIIYGVIHDCPLHEALKTAGRFIAGLGQPGSALLGSLLRADPASNHDLRMAEALDELHTEAMGVAQTATSGDLSGFLNRMGSDAGEELRDGLSQAFQGVVPVQDVIGQVRSAQFSFQRESQGLVPLAQAEAALAKAYQARREAQATLALVLANPANLAAIRKHQDRRVDIVLDEKDEYATYRAVSGQVLLRPGGRYRLRVHIGHPSEASLMVGEVPPLDPLLPEPEGAQGHQLEVALFPKDFALLSPAVRTLNLPLLGGSQPVYFEIVAPHREGTATLRVGIYHRNHLLQSFVLEAQVGVAGSPSAAAWGGRAVEARLDLARTARFTNLEELRPRRFSIGVNADADGATHTLMLKCGEAAQSLRLTEAALQKQAKKFRQILAKASYDPKEEKPRFTLDEVSSPSRRTLEFEGVIRQLANLGEEIYHGIWQLASDPLQGELLRVAGQADETLQIVRHQPNFVFPWPILYDFETPPEQTGPVCLGFAEGENARVDGGLSPTKRCSHGPRDRVYCLYGFWGVRHHIEQLLGHANRLQDAVNTVVPTQPPGRVYLALDRSNTHTNRLVSGLREALGAALVEVEPTDEILDMLWETEQRPAVLIVLGHLDSTGPQPHIVLPGGKRLRASMITQRHIRHGKRWEQPRTLVLLMACGSGATEIDTLNNFVTALSGAGAAAVVGTECLVSTSLVARFAREITTDLWNGIPLGQATTAFNRRLAVSMNPLAFVFNCIGDADLTVAAQSPALEPVA